MKATDALRRSVRPALSKYLQALAYVAPFGTGAGEWFPAPVAKVSERSGRCVRQCFDLGRACIAAGLVEYDEVRKLWRFVVSDLVAAPRVRRASATVRCLLGSVSAVARQFVGSLSRKTIVKQEVAPKAENEFSLGRDEETGRVRCDPAVAAAIIGAAYGNVAQAESLRSAENGGGLKSRPLGAS